MGDGFIENSTADPKYGLYSVREFWASHTIYNFRMIYSYPSYWGYLSAARKLKNA